MTITIKQIREQYPQYNNKSDSELADAIHTKYYSSLPKEAVYDKLGLSSIPPTPFNQPEEGNQAETAEPKTNNWKDIASDAINSIKDTLKSGVAFAGRVPDNLKGIGEEFKENPLGEAKHFAGQLGVALANTGKEFGNIALGALRDPLDEKLSGGKFGKLEIGDTGLQKALGIKSNKKGDELIQAIPDIAALGSGLYGVGKAGTRFLSKSLPMGAEKILRNEMTEKIIASAKEHGASEKEVKALEESLTESFGEKHGKEIGSVNPSAQRTKANIAKHKIKELKPSSEIPEREIPERTIAPDKEKMMEKSKAIYEEATNALSHALKIREEHPRMAGQIISKHVKSVQKAASDLYNKVEKGYKGIEIPVDNTAKINETASNLHKLVEEDLASGESLAPGYGSATSEQKALEAKIKSLEGETVSASDVYDVQRTLQNRAQKARDASFAPGLDKIERTRLQKLAARHESAATKLGNVLEQVGPADTRAMIKEANSGWKYSKDISRSKVGKYIMRNEGKIPADTMFKITGTGKGNEHLRKLVESDPELSNYILGQKYAKPGKHAELLEGNDTVDAYIKRSPDVQEKMTKLKVALKEVAEGKSNYKEAQSEYKNLKKAIEEAGKEQNERKKAIEEIDKLTAQREDHLKASKLIEDKIKIADKKGEDTAKLKEDFERHKREYNDKGNRMDKLKKLALKYVTGKVAYEAIVPNTSH